MRPHFTYFDFKLHFLNDETSHNDGTEKLMRPDFTYFDFNLKSKYVKLN